MESINKIKQERKAKGLTQRQFAELFNKYLADKKITNVKPVTYAAVSRWESGANNPSDETWSSLAGFLDVDVAYIRGYSAVRNTGLHELVNRLNATQFSDNDYQDQQLKNLLIDMYSDFDNQIADLSDEIDSLRRDIYHLQYPNEPNPQDRDDF